MQDKKSQMNILQQMGLNKADVILILQSISNQNQQFDQQKIQQIVINTFTNTNHPYSPSHNYLQCRICNYPFNKHLILQAQLFTKFNTTFKTINCNICYQDIHPDYFYFHEHKSHLICLQCVRKHLNSKIQIGQVILTCPQCNLQLNQKQIQDIVQLQIYKRYKKFKIKKLAAIDNSKIICCGIDCDNIIQNKKKKAKVICQKCNLQICTKCKRVYHPLVNCQTAIRKQFKALGDNFQTCPRCKMGVQKISGCNHMTCSYCRFQFCWLCKSAYTSFHFQMFNPLGCPGLQNSAQKGNWGCVKLILYRLLLLILILVLIGPALIVGAVIGGPIVAYAFIIKDKDYISCFWFLLDPIVIVVSIVSFIPVTIYLLVGYCKQRRRMMNQSNRALMRRLIQPQQQQQQYDSYS